MPEARTRAVKFNSMSNRRRAEKRLARTTFGCLGIVVALLVMAISYASK